MNSASHFRACETYFKGMPNGTPTNETELTVLLGLAAQPVDDDAPNHAVVAAKVKMAHLGFKGHNLGLTPVERTQILELAHSRLQDEPDPIHLRSMAQRCARAAVLVEKTASERRAACEEIARRLDERLPDGLELAPHQLEMVRRIEEASHRFLVLDDMGLGKTVSALASLALVGEHAFPIVIASPLSVVYNWKKETEKWLERFEPEVIQLTGRLDVDTITEKLDRNLVLTGSWQQIITWQKILISKVRPATIIGDESHYIANWRSQRSRALIRVRGQAKHVLCLTGTAEPNGRHREMFAQIKAVAGADAFDHLPGGKHNPWKAYARRYCGPKTIFLGKKKNGQPRRRTSYDGRSHDVEFGWLIAPFSLRRTKSEVFGSEGLPPKTRYKIPIEVSTRDKLKIAAERDAVRAELLERARALEDELTEEGIDAHTISERVRAVLSSQAVTELGRVRRLVSTIKMRWAVRQAKELKSEGHRVVLFCEFLDTARELTRRLEKASPGGVLAGIGSMSAGARGKLVERAQSDDGIQYVVLTQAFREGITLTAYTRTIMVDRWWLPGWEMQAEDRIHRMGQTHPTAIIYPHIEGSTDEAMGRLQAWKEEGSEQVLGSASIRAYTWLFDNEASP